MCRPGTRERDASRRPPACDSATLAAVGAQRRSARARRPDASRPKSTTRRAGARARPRARRRRARSSALSTAMPPRRQRADRASACSAATSATLAHEFLVLALRVVDERDRRLRDRRELARSRRGWFMPSSIDGGAVRGAQAQQRQRQADRVVEIALASRARAASPKCARRIAASISLTVVLPLLPTTTMTGMRELRAPVRGERAERRQRVGDRDQVARRARPRDRRRPAPRRRRARTPPATKSWPSKRSPCKRDEEIAGRERARVGGHAREAHVGADDAARRRRGRRSRCPSCAAPCARARRRRLATSENGVRTPFALLVVLVALAGDQHDVARLRAGDRRRGSPSRGRARRSSGGCRSSRMPRDDRRSAIAAGILAARVVAGDDDAVGERRGDRAHLRALAGVAVAAAAEHADELAARERPRAAAPSAPSPAHRACARSRRRRAAAPPPPRRCMRPGGGSMRASAASASASGTSLASSTPSTPSRFDALNAPTTGGRDVAAAPRGGDRQRDAAGVVGDAPSPRCRRWRGRRSAPAARARARRRRGSGRTGRRR